MNNIISVDKQWELKATEYNVKFRKSIQTNEYDKIFLRLLSLHEGKMEKEQLGLLLGFGMVDEKENNLYKDIAEIQIFEGFLESLENFNLIEESNKEIKLSYWGKVALETGFKYTFHEGEVFVYDHIYLNYEENENTLFPFYKFPIKSEITNIKEAKCYNLEENEDVDFLLNKIRFNINSKEQSKFVIDSIVTDDNSKNRITKKVTQVTIDLKRYEDGNYIETRISNEIFTELNEILLFTDNEDVYKSLLYYAEYSAIKKDAKKLPKTILSKYKEYIDWKTILADNRIEWTNDLLEFLTQDDISNSSLWGDIVKYAPINFLKQNLDNYRDYINWLELTTRIDTEYIVKTYQKYSWDEDVLIKRASDKEIEFLLENKFLELEYVDWSLLTHKVSDTFLEANINNINFNLLLFTKEREGLCQRLITQYPNKYWDWMEISFNYDLTFLLENIENLIENLHLEILINRFLNTEDELFNAFKNNWIINSWITEYSKEKKHFRISSSPKVKLDLDRLIFLEQCDLLYWGDKNVIGLEANEGIDWSNAIFLRYKDNISSYKGQNAVSSSIQDLNIIDSHSDFQWNWSVLSKRANFINNIDFIKKYKDQINYKNFVFSIPIKLLKYELIYFQEWADSLKQVETLVNCLEERLNLQELFTVIVTYGLYDAHFNWSKVIEKVEQSDLESNLILHQNTISRFDNQAKLINLVTHKLDINFILNNGDLLWNWKIVTRNKLSHEQLKDNEILSQYTSKLDWVYIVKEVFTSEELSFNERLPETATYISFSHEQVQQLTWKVITKRLSSFELWKAIDNTKNDTIFKWDWDFISSSDRILDKFSLKELYEYSNYINWGRLSKNSNPNKVWRYSRDSYKTIEIWEQNVLKYLFQFKNQWNFESLSKFDSITWNSTIIDTYRNKWDWDILSKQGQLLTDKTGGRLNGRNLKLFSDKINWQILSTRYELEINENTFLRNSNKDWNYQILSEHPKINLTFRVVEKTLDKNWDYKLLSTHPKLTLSIELLRKAVDKDWDWKVLTKKLTKKILLNIVQDDYEWFLSKEIDWAYLSAENWVDLEVVSKFKDRDWDWISFNRKLTKEILFNIDREYYEWFLSEKLNWKFLSRENWVDLEIVSEFKDRNWDWKIVTKKLTKDILLGIDKTYVWVLSKDLDWAYLSRQKWVDLVIVDKFKDKDWDWEALTKKLTKKILLQIDETYKWFLSKDIDWVHLSKQNWIDSGIINKFRGYKWDWELISSNENIYFDKTLISILIDKKGVEWDEIFKNTKIELNRTTLELMENQLDSSSCGWDEISKNPKLNFIHSNEENHIDYDLINRFKNRWNWKNLVFDNKIRVSDTKLLEIYKDNLDWKQISNHSEFKPTIENCKIFVDYLDWESITTKINLSEKYLNEFADYLDWNYISKSQTIKFSEELLSKFNTKWNYFLLKENIAVQSSQSAKKYLDNFIKENKTFAFYFKLMEQYSKWKGNVYHFTHITNAVEIIKTREISSRHRASNFADAAGSVVGRRHTAHDFARFYFRPQTPTQFYNECLGMDKESGYLKKWKYWTPETDWVRNSKWVSHYPQARNLGLPKCPVPIFFQFDLQEIIIKIADKCYASNGNMQTNWASVYPLKEVISRFNFENIYSTIDNTSDDNWRTYINYSQQEFLIKDSFDFSDLQKFKVVVRTEADKKQLLGLLDKNDPIRNKIVVDSYKTSIFHNDNRKIDYHIGTNNLSIDSNYEGDGFAKGLFELEINNDTTYKINSGEIITKNNNKIYFYPSIKIEFEDENFCFNVKFYDKVTNKSWEVINYCRNED